MQVVETSRRLCAELAPNSLALIEAFGLPEEMLQSPIASDWVENFNYFNSLHVHHIRWVTTPTTTKESCRAMTSSRKFSTTPSQTSPWATAASQGHFRKITQQNIIMLVTYEGMHWCNSAFQT